MNKGKLNNWVFAFMLLTPMLAFFAGYLFNYNQHYIPTGLIMEDNALYLSYAKQYNDASHFQLLYSNPFNDSPYYPNIYFQVQSILLSLMMKTGMGSFSMIVFVLVSSFFCFRIIISIFDTLIPQTRYRTISIILFAWGGGLLALSGIPVHFMRGPDGQDFFDRIFFLDPGWGWWGLNLGRSLLIGCEAYYHFLFLAAVLLVLRKKWIGALAVLFILSISHPFTGIELLGILCSWLALEKLLVRNNNIPWYFAIGTVAITAFHIFYYLYYLNQFADHRSVSEQFSVNWRLRYFNMLPAYALVAPLAFLAIFTFSKPRAYFQNSNHRLFFCWLVVVLLLVNHELFMKARQPIHFTRGYDWLGFFLLGLPALDPIINYLKSLKPAKLWLGFFFFLFLSDNFLWIVNYIRFTDKTKAVMYISPEQKEILKLVKENSDNRTLVISSDINLAMLSTVYTPAYPWISNPYTTPFYKDKKKSFDDFILTGKEDRDWNGRKIIYIFNITDSLEKSAAAKLTSGRLLKASAGYKVIMTGQ